MARVAILDDYQNVARRMAECVVEALEFIEVEEDERERLAFASRSPQLAIDGTIEVATVRNARECIDGDESLETLVRCLERDAQLRKFFVACLQCFGALTHTLLELALHDFELHLDPPPFEKLGLEFLRTPADARIGPPQMNDADQCNDWR